MSGMIENPQIKTKKCSVCGQELPLSSFSKNPGMRDGYLNTCKTCRNEKAKYRKALKKDEPYPNPDLASFTPLQLITELKVRGYKGDLTFEEVRIHRIKL